ncbi:MAG: SnoaL-like domain-containing protein [Bacteroidia bacterium]|nr:SnoaL-like domain-containing protein [Bacteroidia bacterium]
MLKTFLSMIVLASLMNLFSCDANKDSSNVVAETDSLRTRAKELLNEQQKVEANKKLVADMYQQLFGDKDISAIDKYMTDGYIQHNPALQDGKEALKQGASQWFKGAPKEKVDIQHLNAEGDFVYIHTKSRMGPKTFSVIDIFRIENEKIAEHWDVIQEVPEKSANPHPMF